MINIGTFKTIFWKLSKYGFECAYVDHVGIDLIANNPHTSERMGISVKARSRSEGTENDHMVIGPTLETTKKINNACKALQALLIFFVVSNVGPITIWSFSVPSDLDLALTDIPILSDVWGLFAIKSMPTWST